ncbi:hypothetical protein LPTSP2_34280 [Leptospira ellinghausenii]|uniref:DUF1554 domain-containing protein n=1 Tax=Leptospira ellinghausenii TaxID=1917822 RepID=A0A2P2DHL5_9LEPT|nr:DUF1554 domain-containing protein [Leptospira ellinghausenii]GBF44125.1 hypothetical protein LPTSP2_34280 [Leptospira ellinghausenii]
MFRIFFGVSLKNLALSPFASIFLPSENEKIPQKIYVWVEFSFGFSKHPVLGVACGKNKESNDTVIGTMFVALNANSSCANKDHCKMFVIKANAILNAGISGLDSQCNSDENKPSGSGTYKAMVADGTNRIACTSANCA